MSDSHRDRLADALPWPSELLSAAVVPDVGHSRYVSHFAELFVEAHHAYLSGCPRASIIVAGEALLRAAFARIESEVVQRGPLTVQNRRGKTKTVGTAFELAELPDNLSFAEALDLLKQNRIIPDRTLDVAYTVKDLRNHSAHGQFPLLDEWDPDSPRPLSERNRMLFDDSFVFPEGYRLVPSKQRDTWFTFDCRRYHCGSLKKLGVEEQYAAIQFCLVAEALLGMSQETIRAGDRVRRKDSPRAGTVVETDAFSLVFRAVRWDDGEVESRVRITEIEKDR